MPGPSRSNRDTKQSPQGRMWTDIGRHTLQTSLTSWLLLAREAQAMQEKCRTCQANPHQAEVSLSWTMILTGGLNMSSFCVTTPSQMAKRKAKNCKNTPSQRVHLRRRCSLALEERVNRIITPLPWMGGSQPSNERSSRRRRRRTPGFEETVPTNTKYGVLLANNGRRYRPLCSEMP